MIRKIFGLLLCIITVKVSFAQSNLTTNRIINQKIQTGYLMQKVGTTIIDNDTCINSAQSKSSLYLNETGMPTDGRMPWYSDLVPLLTIPCTSTSWLLCATQNADYSSCGSYIYSQGFNNTLTTFTRTKIPATNTFWLGTTANCGITPATTAGTTTTTTAARTASTSSTSSTTDSSAILSAAAAADVAASQTTTTTTTTTKSAKASLAAAAATVFTGPLNRCGMWANCAGATGVGTQWIGIKRTITANATQTIYIGVGARSAFKIVIDALTVVTYGSAGNVQPYKIWHIFPIQMGPGIHTLTIQAQNINEVGVLGVEFYNNTPAEITAATDYTGLKLLFSTKDMVGKYICL